jgi:hypothetical protein
VDTVTADYNAVKEKHTATQNSLASSEDLLQTLLTGLAGTSAQSTGGGGYMGQIADARSRLAQAAAEEEQIRVKLDMSRRELGELEKRWKAVEREAGQGERDIKKMQVEVETLRKKADSTGWNEEKEHVSVEALRNAKGDANRCIQVRALSVSCKQLTQWVGGLHRSVTRFVRGIPSSISIIPHHRDSTLAKSRALSLRSSRSSLKTTVKAPRSKSPQEASCTTSSWRTSAWARISSSVVASRSA